MKFVKQIERLQDLDNMIGARSTGTPEEFACRLGISRSQLYNLLAYLNDIGIEVKYSRSLKSFYYYHSDKHIEINFSIKIMTNKETFKIYGRGFLYLINPQYII